MQKGNKGKLPGGAKLPCCRFGEQYDYIA